MNQTDHNTWDYKLRDWAYSLTTLSEKMKRSNHLQMLEQRQHLFLNYFNILSGGLARIKLEPFATVEWCLTKYTNQAAAPIFE